MSRLITKEYMLPAIQHKTDAAVMARRLHIGIKAMRRLPSFTTDAPASLAKVCANPSNSTAASLKRLSHVETRYVESTPGRLIHMDICGPLPEARLGRFRHAMVLVDDSTRFKMGLELRSREEAGAHIRRFISRFNSLAAHSQGRISKVGTLLTDGAREFQHIASLELTLLTAYLCGQMAALLKRWQAVVASFSMLFIAKAFHGIGVVRLRVGKHQLHEVLDGKLLRPVLIRLRVQLSTASMVLAKRGASET